jgi:hypothetical protein
VSRRRPYDPAAAEAARQARLEGKAEVARLKRQGAEVNLDAGGKILSALRRNAFSALLRAGALTQNQHDAALRLMTDWAIWKGLDGRPDALMRVDGGGGRAELVTDRMLAAGRRVEAALGDVGRADRRLLAALIGEAVEADRPRPWRTLVAEVAGETREKEQRATVVSALENLRLWYEAPRRVA